MTKNQPSTSTLDSDIATRYSTRRRELWEDQPCSICRVFKSAKKCTGHGVGGGVETGESESKEKNSATLSRSTATSPINAPAISASESRVSFSPSPQSESDKELFDSDVISQLLEDKILLIDNNSEIGRLTFRLLWNLNELSPKQRKEFEKFIIVILDELEKFKAKHGIEKTNSCIVQEPGEKIAFSIVLPPKLYQLFIEQLANKHLLPIENIEQKPGEKVVYEKGQNHFSPSPLGMKPTPSVKKDQDEHVEKQRSFRVLKTKPTPPGVI